MSILSRQLGLDRPPSLPVSPAGSIPTGLRQLVSELAAAVRTDNLEARVRVEGHGPTRTDPG